MAERDPRRDPMPGDVVGRRQVVSVVGCEFTTNPVRVDWVVTCSNWGSCSLASWRKWARNAEVIYVAD